jgi:hypothetical protein
MVSFTTDKTSAAQGPQVSLLQLSDRCQRQLQGHGDPPGDYVIVVVVKKDVHEDYQMLTLKAGDDKTLDFDMTRAEYINSLTPEMRKQVEETRRRRTLRRSPPTR